MTQPRLAPALTTIASLALAGSLTACTVGHDASRDGKGSSAHASSTPSSSSSTQLSAKEIWSSTQSNVAKATSVRVDGSDSPNGSGPNVVFSGQLSGDPSEIEFKDASMGSFTMRRIGGKLYLKGDLKYWQSIEKDDPSTKGSTEAANRWVTIPASAVGKDDLSKLIAKTYVASIGDSSDPKWGAIADSGSTMSDDTVDGHDAHKIVSPDGDTTVWVAKDGSNDLLKVRDEAAGDDDLGQATFSRWNDTFDITKPKGAIGGGGSESPSSDDASPEATT